MERLQLGLARHRAHALQVHADGSPMPYAPPLTVDELPSVSADVALLRAELLLRTRTEAAE